MEFEEKLEKLENILQQLNTGSAPLKQTISLYEEGSALLKELNEELNQAEKKIKMLTQEDTLEDFE